MKQLLVHCIRCTKASSTSRPIHACSVNEYSVWTIATHATVHCSYDAVSNRTCANWSGTRAVSDEQSPLGWTLMTSRHNCMKYSSDFMQLCLEVIKVQPSGDCSSETAMVPLLYESEYAIKNCLTLLDSDLIFLYLKHIFLNLIYYTIYKYVLKKYIKT